jgi:hypothetical protein
MHAEPKLQNPSRQRIQLEEKIMSQPCARRPIRIGFWCLLLVTLVVQPLLAQAPPSADTFVSSSTPKTNYGSTIALVVGSGTTSYVRFDLAGIPAGSSISKATLRLYVDAVAKNGTFDVYQLNSSWAENTLTYNTPPPPLGLSVTNGTGVSITTASWNQFLLIDITALAQSWVNGTVPNNGVALTSGSNGSFSFDPKESLLTGNGPELEIAFNGGTGPQGPQGPIGPAGPQGPQGVAGAVGPTGATGLQSATGLQGAQGPLGPMGLTGAQGLQGVAGPQGAAGTGFNFRAAFDNTVSYAAYDVVSYNGSSYNAKTATNPGDPTPDVNPNWSLMAQQGAAGPGGAQGAVGPQGMPGPMGLQGPQGPQGPPGVAPPNTAVTNAPNTFAASQTVNGNLILGAGGAVQFADGTTQNTATAGGSGVPSGFMILGTSPITPAGYTLGAPISSGNVWFSMAPMPTARYRLAAATVNGKIYAIGGYNGGYLNTVEVYDPSANTWSTAPPMPTARYELAAAVVNGKIYAIRGYNGGYLNTVEVYDPSTNTWSTAAPMPTARGALAAATVNGKM